MREWYKRARESEARRVVRTVGEYVASEPFKIDRKEFKWYTLSTIVLLVMMFFATRLGFTVFMGGYVITTIYFYLRWSHNGWYVRQLVKWTKPYEAYLAKLEKQ